MFEVQILYGYIYIKINNTNGRARIYIQHPCINKHRYECDGTYMHLKRSAHYHGKT